MLEIESIYNSAHVGLCVFDRQLRFVRINKRLAEIHGVPAEYHIGKIPREIVPELADEAEQLAEKIFKTGKPILNIEVSGVTPAKPDVQRHWITHWLPLRNNQGNVEGINVVVEEITELKKAQEAQKQVEEALGESEQKLARELKTAELMQDLSTQLIQVDNVETLYDQILATLLKILRCDFATIQQFHPQSGTEGALHLLRDYGFGEFDTGCCEWITSHSYTPCGLALKTGKRVVLDDVLKCDYMAKGDVLEQYQRAGIRAGQSTPLLSRSGDLLGMISTYWREPHELTKSEIRSVDILARQAADLIERMQGEAALKKAHNELEYIVAQRTEELSLANKRLQQEIDQRIKKEKALRDSEEKFRLHADNTPDFIINYDRQLRITFVNKSMCRLFGLERNEFVGKTLGDLFPKDPTQKWEVGMNKALAGDITEHESTAHMPDGTVRSYWFTLVPIIDEQGNIIGITERCRDITERKKMEEEVLKADKLESIALLAGGIAHDFNNNLTAVLGNISLALRDIQKEEKNYKRLKNAEKAIHQAKDLTRQLQTFAKGWEPVKTTISIKKLIRRVIPFYLSGSNVKCNYYFPKKLSYVNVDEGQISQVIENLVINATQAMPDGGPIQVNAEEVIFEKDKVNDCECSIKDGLYVKIMVQDRGVGIDPKNLKKIFDPFFTTKEQGSGLGMAISYSIIKKHGGCIKVESEPGEGTTVSIYLPASSEKVLTKGNNKKSIVKGSGRILVMDDEKAIRDVLGEMLTFLGYQVDFANRGEEAIEKYKSMMELKKPYDFVILDLTVPGGMGGKQAMSLLKNIDPNIKAVVSTGYSEDLAEINCRDYGFRGFILKPYSIEQLSEVLSRLKAGA